MEWLHVAGRTVGMPSYAARRMAMRGISKTEIKSVLADPTRLAPSRDSPVRFVLRRTVRGRRLVAVIEGVQGGESRWVVVTAWEEGQDG